MSRRGIYLVFAVLTVIALALPVAARNDNPTQPKLLVSMSVDLNNSATLGGTQLKPGSYSVKADGDKVTLLRGGKSIAEAPVQWKDENGKASYSSIVTEGGRIKEIHFNGKSKYVEIAQ
jgi:hypothetical protein